MVTRETLGPVLRDLGLERLESTLDALARTAIRIHATPSSGDKIPVGKSKIGGLPEFGPSEAWPTGPNGPLNFIAQFDCAELGRFEAASVLPTAGLLSFFYDAEEQAWGFDPSHRGRWQMIYQLPGTQLRRAVRSDAAATTKVFRSNELDYTEFLSFPHQAQFSELGGLQYWDSDVAGFDVEPDEIQRLKSLYDAIDAPEPQHQLFGYPYVLQSEMELECQLVSHGIYCGAAYPPEAVERLGEGAQDWRLLLQLDSALDMQWGDTGLIYYWMTTEALRARDYASA
jgi:uncharacterized protein YwqG